METMTGIGIPAIAPAPMKTIVGLSIKIAEVSEIATDNPANTFIVPSVTMNAGIPRKDTNKPLMIPTIVPLRIAAKLAIPALYPALRKIASTTPEKVKTLPRDRSNPPEINNNVAIVANTHSVEPLRRTLVRFAT